MYIQQLQRCNVCYLEDETRETRIQKWSVTMMPPTDGGTATVCAGICHKKCYSYRRWQAIHCIIPITVLYVCTADPKYMHPKRNGTEK